MEHSNVFTGDYEYDEEDPPGWRCAALLLSSKGGELNVKAFELPVGEHLCPYHYEYVEEWLIVLRGQVDVRTPDGTEVLGDGGVMTFPAGPDGAHRVSNLSGSETARIVMFSSSQEPAMAVYPDSDKIGVWTGNQADDFMFQRASGQVPYYAGEPGT
jgi:uncharacterized cupin superfamily protein